MCTYGIVIEGGFFRSGLVVGRGNSSISLPLLYDIAIYEREAEPGKEGKGGGELRR